MNYAMIYHWWNDVIEKIEDDLFNPLLLAIITVRHFDENIAIYVINCSDIETNWGVYPEKLNFKVIKKRKRFNFSGLYDSMSLSRIWDITEVIETISEEVVIFNDSDVFWIKSIFPLINSLDRFNCNRNNGVFYFSKNSKKSQQFIELWKERTKAIMDDKTYRDKFKNNIIHDELVVRTIQDDYSNLYHPIKMEENGIVFNPIINKCKNIHLIRGFVGKKNRRAVALSILEIRNIILKFSKNIDIFGSLYLESFSLDELTTKNAIKKLCRFDGEYTKSIRYGSSKIC